MKAVVFYRPGDIRFEEVATPTPAPGEVLVRIGSALTCGTDLKTYRRGHPIMIKTNKKTTFARGASRTISSVSC